MHNADPIKDRGDYAHKIDESGLIRGRIVEESLMGRIAARRFQKEINEIVGDHVPLRFLPLWKKITIKMQKVIKKHFKKLEKDLLVRWDKDQVLTSVTAKYTQNAFMVEYFIQPAEYEIQNMRLTQQPIKMDGLQQVGISIQTFRRFMLGWRWLVIASIKEFLATSKFISFFALH